MQEKECFYCGEHKSPDEFNLEHIWPKRLGQPKPPKILLTNNVCKACNLYCGLNVDGMFLKSMIGQTEISQNARLGLNENSIKPIPLIILGFVENFPCADNERAVFFLGPAGDQIYYVDDASFFENWFGYMGGDPRSQYRNGRVYFGIRSAEPFWVQTLFSSIKKQFPKSTRLCATTIENEDGSLLFEANCPKDIVAFMRTANVTGQAEVNLHFLRPFMAKLALGIGGNLYGSPFLKSKETTLLRNILKAKNQAYTLDLPVQIASYGKPESGVEALPYVPDCWTLTISPLQDKTILTVQHPSGAMSSVSISGEYQLLAEDLTVGQSTSFVACPALSLVVGPLDTVDIIESRFSETSLIVLSAIEKARSQSQSLPPF
ncbi:MAG: HNH endonuclease [Marinosulfonomonas sp.]|nr:HNH endonuclease [Marinosulfonomonas sp.]